MFTIFLIENKINNSWKKMGCSCCEVTYLDEVEDKILSYINRINKPEDTKNKLIRHIKEDLLRRASTVDRYHYPYRNEDVELTVDLYKKYIYTNLWGNFILIEDKIKKVENEEKAKLIENEEKKEEKQEEKVDEKEIKIKNLILSVNENKKEENEIKENKENKKVEINNEIIINKKVPTKLENNNIQINEG